jgi:hypothetical protein
MGPKRKGSQRTGTPAAAAASPIRAAERYEYVLPNSNQNSRLVVFTAPSNEACPYRPLTAGFPFETVLGQKYSRHPVRKVGHGAYAAALEEFLTIKSSYL